MKRLILAALALFLAAGCSQTNLSEAIKAAAGDPASVNLRSDFNGWGASYKGSICRTGLVNVRVTCGTDGSMTIETVGGSTIQVPLTVTTTPTQAVPAPVLPLPLGK